MEKQIKRLSVVYIVFLAMLILSGSFDGILSKVVYFLSFAAPFALCEYMMREEDGRRGLFKLSPMDGLLLLPALAPTIAVVLGISVATSLLMSAFGYSVPEVKLPDSLVTAIIVHAIVPAVLEELLFRYLPMKYISDHSPLYTILLSGIFFSLAHHSLYSIPYAFFAGMLFMALNIIFDSIWPSVVLHAVNNVVSVLLMHFATSGQFVFTFYVVLFVAVVASAVAFLLCRKAYLRRFSAIHRGGGSFSMPSEMIIFIVISFVLAAAELAL